MSSISGCTIRRIRSRQLWLLGHLRMRRTPGGLWRPRHGRQLLMLLLYALRPGQRDRRCAEQRRWLLLLLLLLLLLEGFGFGYGGSVRRGLERLGRRGAPRRRRRKRPLPPTI